MRRFILKSLLLIAAVAGILFAANALYVRSPMYQAMEQIDGTDNFHAMPESVDVAVFGASHGNRSFVFVPDGHTLFNFCLSGQSPQYDLMLMREYQDHIAPGALVILTFSYSSPFFPERAAGFSEKQSRYYRILSPENLIDPDPLHMLLQKHLPLLEESLTSLVGSLASTVLGQAARDAQNTTRQTSPEEMPAEQTRMKRTQWEEKIAPSFSDTDPTAMDAYRQMLAMCRDHGWQAVLVTPPFLDEYRACFPDEFYPVFYDAANTLAEEYDVPYIDYSFDSAYASRYDLYLNIDHLNLAGAEMFDAQFFDDLAAQGIWE